MLRALANFMIVRRFGDFSPLSILPMYEISSPANSDNLLLLSFLLNLISLTFVANSAIEHFFGIKNADVNINGLTAGDFATVKKKTDFLGTTDLNEITKMLNDEVKVKKSKELQNTIGF